MVYYGHFLILIIFSGVILKVILSKKKKYLILFGISFIMGFFIEYKNNKLSLNAPVIYTKTFFSIKSLPLTILLGWPTFSLITFFFTEFFSTNRFNFIFLTSFFSLLIGSLVELLGHYGNLWHWNNNLTFLFPPNLFGILCFSLVAISSILATKFLIYWRNNNE